MDRVGIEKLVSIINITLEDEVARIKSPMTKIKKMNCSYVQSNPRRKHEHYLVP